ncbi:TPA: GTP pyrophosphokinase [Burkholderia cenocepacia]
MTPDEFGTWLLAKQPALKAWGCFVVSKISERVRDQIGEKRFKNFFKVPPGFRTKDIESATAKLAKKGYADPTVQMTDLVGARFVVLLRTDVRVVEGALSGYTGWTLSRDRDFDFEVSQEPEVFDYQSVHYLVSCPGDMDIEGTLIPGGTTCEVQIRTLLQHAYAEVVHDNVYKPGGVVPPQTRRIIARSMAFVESADELFCEAIDQLARVNTAREQWVEFLVPLYLAISGRDVSQTDQQDTLAVVDTFRDVLASADRGEIEQRVSAPAISRLIRRRSENDGLFGRPICILAYWLAEQNPRNLMENWPFGSQDADLRNVLADLGIAAR